MEGERRENSGTRNSSLVLVEKLVNKTEKVSLKIKNYYSQDFHPRRMRVLLPTSSDVITITAVSVTSSSLYADIVVPRF